MTIDWTAELVAQLDSAEGAFAELPMTALVPHINREAVHHGAEICLPRDPYRSRG